MGKYGIDIKMNARFRRDHEHGFECARCGTLVPGRGSGTKHRNHCPNCLHSLHVDIRPGDRMSGCMRVMEPIAVWTKKNGEWAIIHRCLECGKLGSNRIAGDDNEIILMSLAIRPLARPPFPLERLMSALPDVS